jgi:chromosome segregation ATPase
MRSMIYSIIFFISLCFAVSEPHAAHLFLWTDDSGRMHITEVPPAKESSVRDVFEYEPRAEPQAADSSDAAETENRDNEARCRNVFESRRTLRKTKSVAAAVQRRAAEARDKVQDLRRRIGFDDDRRDDFKDDLKRLEENANRAEMFAQQAELNVQVSELQVKMAEMDAGDPCAEKDRFY